MYFFLSLCCVFISFILYDFFFYHFGVLIERSAFFQLHLNTTNFVCQVHFWIMIFERFHFEICADLPPGRHTMILYTNIIQHRAYVQSFRVIFGHVFCEAEEDKHVATILLDPDCTEKAIAHQVFYILFNLRKVCKCSVILIQRGFCATVLEKCRSAFLLTL